jgi:hypothetical protein
MSSITTLALHICILQRAEKIPKKAFIKWPSVCMLGKSTSHGQAGTCINPSPSFSSYFSEEMHTVDGDIKLLTVIWAWTVHFYFSSTFCLIILLFLSRYNAQYSRYNAQYSRWCCSLMPRLGTTDAQHWSVMMFEVETWWWFDSIQTESVIISVSVLLCET